jgi:polyisoprenoid-binding protein YceI
MRFSFLIFMAFISLPAQAQSFKLLGPETGKSKIGFTLPYSAGVHKGEVPKASGEFHLDPKNQEKITGLIRIPISEMKTGNDQRDCHMREALGLDYTKTEYPKVHVCSKDDKLPVEGPNSVVYPEIKFEITGMKSSAMAMGNWEIHGVKRAAEVPLEITKDGDMVRVWGKYDFHLADFGVEVKPAKIVFVTISVHDPATAQFDLLFQKSGL